MDDVADYVADVAAVIRLAKSRHPGLPVFLLGHSAGGVVSSTYALDHQAEIAGLICESFAFKVPAPDAVLAVIKGLARIAPRLPVLKLKNEDFSRDPIAVRILNSDPLTPNEVQPAKTVAALVRANERLAESSRASRFRSSSCTGPRTRRRCPPEASCSTTRPARRTRR